MPSKPRRRQAASQNTTRRVALTLVLVDDFGEIIDIWPRPPTADAWCLDGIDKVDGVDGIDSGHC
jgi:hypothetical protein